MQIFCEIFSTERTFVCFFTLKHLKLYNMLINIVVTKIIACKMTITPKMTYTPIFFALTFAISKIIS